MGKKKSISHSRLLSIDQLINLSHPPSIKEEC